ncbi:RHS repeat-associated core domain-containing protein [Fulvimonas yonginensis]|uniref:RHS repeat-associated core domain-containing protein n=1 Tax=Fulvimonas yonginensis TaxID=1495200 RepID=A0ABU8JFI2_9GAMM
MKGHTFRALVAVTLWMLGHVAHASTVTYVYSDPQGTPLAEADASGNITATFDYRPYGAQALGSPQNGPGYTGHINDADSNLVYMQARYYDLNAGRFISCDPVKEKNSLPTINSYWYASDNPVNMIDPDGKDSLWVQDGTHTTIVIPVNFVGNDASKQNINAIISMAKQLEVLNRNYSVSIVSTNQPIQGQLNKMDLSPGYDFKHYPQAGEGVNDRGGNVGHINTSNNGWLRAALHDILHFAAFKDGYISAGKGDGRVVVGYLTGYSVDNIMANRQGNVISDREIEEARDYGDRRDSNRLCRPVGPHHEIQCQ